MRCARCAILVDPEDNYCRHCGASLNRRGLPTVVSPSLLPVPWSLARGPVARGVAALVVGTVLELVRREVERRSAVADPARALSLLSAGKPAEAGRRRFPWSRVPRGEYEVTETVVQRHVRFLKR